MGVRRALLAVFIAVLGLAKAPPALADPIPVVRVETAAHQAFINRIVVLDAQRLLTVSDDQTARAWNRRGKGLDVIRGRTGARDEGALYAAATSPSHLALGGRAGMDEGAAYVRLLDRRTLMPVGVLGQLPDIVTALAFSADGKRLAVGFDQAGVRVYTLGQGAPQAVLPGPGGPVSDLGFTADGRLIVVADGGLQIVEANLSDIRKVSLEDGFQPWRATLSPDGRALAIGSRAAAIGAFIDLKTLAVRTVALGGAGAAPATAWLADGSAIFGGGAERGGRLWRVSREGRVTAAAETRGPPITAVTGDGGAVFADADGGWGQWLPSAEPTYHSRPAKLSFRSMSSAPLAVSSDGARVELSHDGKPFVVLDLMKRQATRTALSNRPPPAEGKAVVSPPAIDRPERAERLLSSARSQDGRGWVVGTNFFIRKLDAAGRTIWKAPAAAPTWGVAVARAGGLVVAALGDGTVRWLDEADGAVLLDAFVSPNLDWAAWTPDGYFDRGANGAQLIGYAIDRGPRNGADFIDLDRTGRVYFRSDLVQAALRRGRIDREMLKTARTATGAAAPRLIADAPPRVTIEALCGIDQTLDRPTTCFEGTNLSEGVTWKRLVTGRQVLVSIAMRDTTGPLGATQLKVAGVVRRPQNEEILKAEGVERRRFRVDLPEGDPAIEVSVANVGGSARSATAQQKVLAVPREGGGAQASLHLLAIGVADYQLASFDLGEGVASNDALSLAAALSSKDNYAFPRADTQVLTDDKATSKAIRAGLATVVAKAQPQDLVVIFFSGHGLQVDGDYVFAPYELGFSSSREILAKAKRGEAFPDQLLAEVFRADGVGQSELTEALARLRASRVLIILDTCFGGSFSAMAPSQRDSVNSALGERFAEASGRYVIASARGFALDDPEARARNSVFTASLLRGLTGEGDRDKDGAVTLAELADHVRSDLPRRTAALGAEQRPVISFFGDPYFPLTKTAP